MMMLLLAFVLAVVVHVLSMAIARLLCGVTRKCILFGLGPAIWVVAGMARAMDGALAVGVYLFGLLAR